mgnify:CR=1 FL=1
MMHHIVFYTAPLCGDCQKLKAFMDAHGLEYEVRDIKADPAHAQELEANTGKLGVPYLIINGEWKRGYVPHEPFSQDFARELFGLPSPA